MIEGRQKHLRGQKRSSELRPLHTRSSYEPVPRAAFRDVAFAIDTARGAEGGSEA